MNGEKVKEIKKGLEICQGLCNETCPYYSLRCMTDLSKDSLTLINELENKCDDCAGCTQWKCDCANIKTEALKQFAERVKMEFFYEFEEIIPSIMADKIDKLVEEFLTKK